MLCKVAEFSLFWSGLKREDLKPGSWDGFGVDIINSCFFWYKLFLFVNDGEEDFFLSASLSENKINQSLYQHGCLHVQVAWLDLKCMWNIAATNSKTIVQPTYRIY